MWLDEIFAGITLYCWAMTIWNLCCVHVFCGVGAVFQRDLSQD